MAAISKTNVKGKEFGQTRVNVEINIFFQISVSEYELIP